MATVTFGRYAGKPIDYMIEDKDYMTWLNSQDWWKKHKFYKTYIDRIKTANRKDKHPVSTADNSCKTLEDYINKTKLDEIFIKQLTYKYQGEPNGQILDIEIKYKALEDYNKSKIIIPI